MSASVHTHSQTNWAGNVAFRAERVHTPTSVVALQEIVAGSSAVRALGTGHSFSAIADTRGDLVRTAGLPQTIELDRDRRQVKVGGGVRYGELGRELLRAGLALPNTGSLPHISVAGACATGTHGSGLQSRVLAAGVRALTLVTADGELLTVERGMGEEFAGWVLALGRLGIVVDLTVDVVDAFHVAQTVVEELPGEAVASHLGAILTASYSVSVFTDWGTPARTSVWLKERPGPDAGPPAGRPLWGGRLADGPRNPVPGMPAENATPQLGVPGPWNERLPHFRLEFMPSSGDELQSEYLLPVEHAAAAWQALTEVGHLVHPLLQIGEVRTVGADPLWLSQTGGVDSAAFHFTWVNDIAAVRPVVAAVEERLQAFGARPHWGKVFGTSPAGLDAMYPRLGDFRRLVRRVDPDGTFANHEVDAWLGL